MSMYAEFDGSADQPFQSPEKMYDNKLRATFQGVVDSLDGHPILGPHFITLQQVSNHFPIHLTAGDIPNFPSSPYSFDDAPLLHMSFNVVADHELNERLVVPEIRINTDLVSDIRRPGNLRAFEENCMMEIPRLATLLRHATNQNQQYIWEMRDVHKKAVDAQLAYATYLAQTTGVTHPILNLDRETLITRSMGAFAVLPCDFKDVETAAAAPSAKNAIDPRFLHTLIYRAGESREIKERIYSAFLFAREAYTPMLLAEAFDRERFTIEDRVKADMGVNASGFLTANEGELELRARNQFASQPETQRRVRAAHGLLVFMSTIYTTLAETN